MAKSPVKTTRKGARAGNDNPGGRKSSVGLDLPQPKIGGVSTQPLDLVYNAKPGNKNVRKPSKKK